MNYLQIVLMPFISIAVLYLLSRLIGYRQMSQLSLFDYINGITIGSIASEVAISPLKELWPPLAALLIYGIITYIFAVLTDKSIKARRLLTGKPIVLVSKGMFFESEFSKARLDISEFMIQCRNQGYFHVEEIDTAIMEPNGILSILPKSQARPVTPEDMNYVLKQEEILANVIMDSDIMKKNLENIGFNEKWLIEQIKGLGLELKQVFLATCSKDGQLKIYKKNGEYKKDILS